MTILFPRLKRKATGWCEATIGADKGEQIAVAIEAAAPAPGEGCDPRWCHCHSRHTAWLEAAAIARQTGGVG